MTSYPPPDDDRPAEYGGPPSFEKQPTAPEPHAYGQPAAPYGQPAPTQQYRPPPHSQPPPYGQPPQPYGAPAEQYGQPPQQYGQPPTPYGQPPQQYGQQQGYPGASPYGGYPATGGYPTAAAGPGQNGLGIAGMVVGIASLVLFWTYGLSLVVGATGAILSAVAMRQARARGQGVAMSVAGLVCGILGFVIGIAWIAFWIWFANSYDDYSTY